MRELRGIRQGSANEKGNNRIGQQDNLTHQYSQSDMAKDLHMSRQQLQDYKKLLNLIPELKDMVKQNELSATVGYKIWARMPHEEQNKFFEEIGCEKIKTLTQKATKEYIDKINSLEKELDITISYRQAYRIERSS